MRHFRPPTRPILVVLITVLAFAPTADARAHHRSRLCVVPRLHNVTLKVARHRIREAGCEVGRLHRPDGHGTLTVRHQSPRPHARRKHDAKVSLWLRRKSSRPQVTVPTLPAPASPVSPASPVAVTTTVAPIAVPAVVRAGIDPSFTQDPADNLHVTWSYSASATGTLPDGTLSFTVTPNTNQLSAVGTCTINVGGSTTGGTCSLELPDYGAYRTTVSYVGASTTVAPSTASEVDTIEPLPTTITHAWGTDYPSDTPTITTRVVRTAQMVTVSDADFMGVNVITVTDNLGDTCSATVSGTTASCTMDASSAPSSYTVAWPGIPNTVANVPVGDGGTQQVTTEWPAQTINVASPSVTVQAAQLLECGGWVTGGWHTPGTVCDTADQWEDPIVVPVNTRMELGASVQGNAPGDPVPLGTISFDVTGPAAPSFTAPMSGESTSGCDGESNTGGQATGGGCEWVFSTPGVYTVTVSFVDADGQYSDLPDGITATINVQP